MSDRPGDRPTDPGGAGMTAALNGVVVLGIVVAFAPIVGNGFVNWDDGFNFLENPHLEGSAWSRVRWAWTTFWMGDYKPLTWMVIEGEHALWGSDPRGYHLVSLTLHAVNALALSALVATILRIAWPAASRADRVRLATASALATALYALHPLRVEAVAWATCQGYLLCTCLAIATAHTYLGEDSAARPSVSLPYRRTLAGYVASLLCFPASIALPIALLALRAFPLRRLPDPRPGAIVSSWRRLLGRVGPFLLAALTFIALAFLAKRSSGALMPVARYGLAARALQSFYCVWIYLVRTVWPSGLHAHYAIPAAISLSDPKFLLPLAAILALSAVLVLLRRRLMGVLAAWVGYLAILAPTLGPAGYGNQFGSDRYTYLAAIPIAVLVGSLLYRLRGAWHAAACVLALAAAVGLATLTFRQCRTWRDSEALWTHSLALQGGVDPLAQRTLGLAYYQRGRFEDAIARYRESSRQDPASAATHFNLGEALEKLRRWPEAVAEYEAGLRLSPEDVEGHLHLASALARVGKSVEAFDHLETAVRVGPGSAEAHRRLGVALADRGRFGEAARRFAEVTKLRPDSARDRRDYGLILAQIGRLPEATRELIAAVRLDPASPEGHLDLGLVLADQGRLAEAERELNEVLRLRPGHDEARRVLERIRRAGRAP